MIMRVGGRFPYLQESESIHCTGEGKSKVCGVVCVCVLSLIVSVCTCEQAEGAEIFDTPIDVESKHNNK